MNAVIAARPTFVRDAYARELESAHRALNDAAWDREQGDRAGAAYMLRRAAHYRLQAMRLTELNQPALRA